MEEAVFGALPCDGLFGHFGKAGVVDADLCEGGREAELFFEVFPQAFDAFLCDLDGVLAFGGDAHDAYGEAGDAGGGGFVQDVGEEGGGEDGEAEAVGDVVVSGEFVLDAVDVDMSVADAQTLAALVPSTSWLPCRLRWRGRSLLSGSRLP